MSIVTITKENFQTEVAEAAVPVLVDFWASWCGPCRMLAPIIAEIAEEQAGKIKVGKLNVDEEPQLAAKYRVMSIPMVALFKNGEVVETSVGYKPKEELIEALGL